MRVRLVTILGFLCGATPAFAQSPASKLAHVVYVAAAGSDVGSQLYSSHYGGHEANPVVSWMEPRLGIVGTLAVGEAMDAAAVILWNRRIAARHPRITSWGLLAVAGARFYITSSNIRKGREFRDFRRAGGILP
jgi:hypothetical protein